MASEKNYSGVHPEASQKYGWCLGFVYVSAEKPTPRNYNERNELRFAFDFVYRDQRVSSSERDGSTQNRFGGVRCSHASDFDHSQYCRIWVEYFPGRRGDQAYDEPRAISNRGLVEFCGRSCLRNDQTGYTDALRRPHG